MIGNLPISGSDLHEIATKGSPTILHAVGRAFGLGADERDALTQGKFPIWLWVVGGIAIGGAIGVYAQKRWPQYLKKVTG